MSYMEYQEVQVPQKIRDFLDKHSPENPVTLGDSGLFEWLNELARDEGWRVVWQGFNVHYIVLEREVGNTLED